MLVVEKKKFYNKLIVDLLLRMQRNQQFPERQKKSKVNTRLEMIEKSRQDPKYIFLIFNFLLLYSYILSIYKQFFSCLVIFLVYFLNYFFAISFFLTSINSKYLNSSTNTFAFASRSACHLLLFFRQVLAKLNS